MAVGAGVPEQLVAAGPADQQVVARPAVQLVVAQAAIQHVVAREAEQDVVAAAPGDGVVDAELALEDVVVVIAELAPWLVRSTVTVTGSLGAPRASSIWKVISRTPRPAGSSSMLRRISW